MFGGVRKGSGFTEKDLERLVKDGKIRGYVVTGEKVKSGGKNKYGAKKVELDGHKFQSTKEARCYVGLRMRERIGEIRNLRLQVPYELNPGGTHSYKYVADFVYEEVKSGCEVVADAKGYRTKEYRKKKKLMKEVHGIDILEM